MNGLTFENVEKTVYEAQIWTSKTPCQNSANWGHIWTLKISCQVKVKMAVRRLGFLEQSRHQIDLERSHNNAGGLLKHLNHVCSVISVDFWKIVNETKGNFRLEIFSKWHNLVTKSNLIIDIFQFCSNINAFETFKRFLTSFLRNNLVGENLAR